MVGWVSFCFSFFEGGVLSGSGGFIVMFFWRKSMDLNVGKIYVCSVVVSGGYLGF